VKKKKRFTPFSIEQQVDELKKRGEVFETVPYMDFIFMDISSHRPSKNVDGDSLLEYILDQSIDNNWADEEMEKEEE